MFVMLSAVVPRSSPLTAAAVSTVGSVAIICSTVCPLASSSSMASAASCALKTVSAPICSASCRTCSSSSPIVPVRALISAMELSKLIAVRTPCVPNATSGATAALIASPNPCSSPPTRRMLFTVVSKPLSNCLSVFVAVSRSSNVPNSEATSIALNKADPSYHQPTLTRSE